MKRMFVHRQKEKSRACSKAVRFLYFFFDRGRKSRGTERAGRYTNGDA